ncbi:pyruvate kinase alpha/beta domain-containing protein [Thermodesulfatator atlanticus]|uniref:pyruvate kinase alpha/beta domain-containing protein n=1 Tax=Thermodesulfatator atlanticus TaxID=501497 RepID=UPI0003B4BFF3|nr:pyruvate kinase alpha/beta domain-containing protein [Thermodesulfatator atlanticus]
MAIYFEKAGRENTDQALKIAYDAFEKRSIKHVIVASTFGDTGLKAAELFKGKGANLIVVTHNVGFREPGKLEMSPETRAKIESLGAKVYTGTMVLRSIGTAIRELQQYSQQDLIANTLRLFGQGIKVCVEIALMACDAGLVPPEDVITVAGTARGADTVAIIKAMPSNKMFSLKVREILAKPRDW